ncbi:MAG: hypothetical protein Q8O00_00205 [Holophaga sp.]|nr:hypothetical protein [Holophaga sp.]
MTKATAPTHGLAVPKVTKLGRGQWPRPELIDAVERHLVKGCSRILKDRGQILRSDDKARIVAAIPSILRVCNFYQEAIFEHTHSARVKTITDDFESLRTALSERVSRDMSVVQQERALIRARGMHHDSRNWLAHLPLQSGAYLLPAKDGQSGESRQARLKKIWELTNAARFAPPPQQSPLIKGGPDWLQLQSSAYGSVRDPLDAKAADGVSESQGPSWVCHPAELLELLNLAEEALLLEVSGPDRGGNTSFFKRRMKTSSKDSFAFSCLLIYERALGGTAKQTNSTKRADRNHGESPFESNFDTHFEEFIALVSDLAVGKDSQKDWKIGPDPIRRAISTARAWRKLYKASGCNDAAGFEALSPESRNHALDALSKRERMKLNPTSRPWV